MLRSHFVWTVTALLMAITFSSEAAGDAGTQHSSGWGMAEIIETDDGSSGHPDVDMDAEGNAMAVWELYESTYYHVCTNRYVKGSGWGEVEYIDTLSLARPYPRVSLDNGGNATAVWVDSNGVDLEIVACRYTKGQGWGKNTILDTSSNEAFYPGVDMDDNGNAMAVWYRSDGTNYSIYSSYYKVGTGWGSALLVETSNTGHAYHPVIALAPDGKGICVWHQEDSGRKDIWTNMFDPYSGWGTPGTLETEDVEDAFSPSLDMDDGGNAMVLWLQSEGPANNVMACRYSVVTGWGEPENIESDPGTVYNGPVIALDPSGDGFATWSQYSGSSYNLIVNRFDVSDGWGVHEVLDGGDHNSITPDLEVDPSGNACIVWVILRGSEETIFSSTLINGMGWTGAEMIEQTSGRGVYPRIGMDEDGNAVAVWSHDDGRSFNVWANRFEMPDLIAPGLYLVSPDEGIDVEISTITVSGITEAGARVIVNGLIAYVDEDGSFSIDVSLFPGPNTITVRSQDPSGNSDSVTRTVTCIDPVPGLVEDMISMMENFSTLEGRVFLDNSSILSMIEVLGADSNLTREELLSIRENLSLLKEDLNSIYEQWMEDTVMMLGLLQGFLNDTIEKMKDDQDRMEGDIEELASEHEALREDLGSLETGEGDLEEEVDSLKTWETILGILVVLVTITIVVAFLVVVLGRKKPDEDILE